MENQNSSLSPKELAGCIDPIRQMYNSFCEVAQMDPSNPYIQYIFFSAAMALYNTMIHVMRNGENQDLANLTKHMMQDLNLYFMEKPITPEH